MGALKPRDGERVISARWSSMRSRIAGVVKYLVLILFSLVAFYPFIWVVLTSLKNNLDLYKDPFGLPKIPAWQNYLDVWLKANISVNFYNSLAVAAIVLLFVLLFSSMASYVLARVWKSSLVYIYLIVGIMIPTQSLLIPTFILIKNLGLMDTRIGLSFVYIAVNISISVFLLVGFMKSIPHELEEAAFIDGAGRGRVFLQVIVPLSLPGLATAGTLTLLGSWNEYIYANVLLSTTVRKTLTLAIASLQGQYFTNYGLLSAGLMVAIIPVTVLYIAFQENVIRGMSAGAVKG